MDRSLIKNKIKRNIIENWKRVASATIIVPIAMVITGFTFGSKTELHNGTYSFTYGNPGILSSLIMIIAITVSFLGIELALNHKQYESLSSKDNLTWLDDSKDWIDLLLLNLIIGIFTFLWTLLLIIPGIIKGYSYSQASFIFFENKRNGTPITYLESITRSRKMMDGYKFDLFILHLSFIGHQIFAIIMIYLGIFLSITVILIPFGIFAFVTSFAILWYVTVYKSFTEAEFYLHIRN